jgi:hypothetical protein
MRSRKNQYNITAPKVHQRAGAMFQEHLKLKDHGRKCPCAVLLNILFFAASRITSVNAYATCYVVRHGQRFTLALTGVKYGEAMEIIIKRLLQRVWKIGVKCRVLLLDRGFYGVAVIRYL